MTDNIDVKTTGGAFGAFLQVTHGFTARVSVMPVEVLSDTRDALVAQLMARRLVMFEQRHLMKNPNEVFHYQEMCAIARVQLMEDGLIFIVDVIHGNMSPERSKVFYNLLTDWGQNQGCIAMEFSSKTPAMARLLHEFSPVEQTRTYRAFLQPKSKVN